jgi:hypothetical protein
MRPDVAAIYSDALSPDARVREGHARLETLKERVRRDPDLGQRVFDYSASWDAGACQVSGLEAFGELVYQQLWAALDQETAAFMARPAPTWQEQERAALDEFIQHRRRDFVGRGTLLQQLEAIALGTAGADASRGACVTGRPGSGKSALFAQLHHRLTEGGQTLVLANAAGATTHGSRVDAMLRRWIGELATRLAIADPIPDNATPDDVEAVFYRVLRQASQATRVVVLVDALNQFEATPRGTHATWFKPAQWPDNAAIIATSLPCTAAEALAEWAGIEELEIPGLTPDDVVAVAKATWRRYHRDIHPEVVRVVAEKRAPDGRPASGNPLWLTLALEQLNLLDADDFARADREFTGSPVERLRALVVDTAGQLPGDVEGLYGWLLAQNEKVFGAAAARAFAVAISLSQRGWRDADLQGSQRGEERVPGIIVRLADVLMPEAEAPLVDDLHLAALRRGFRAHVVRRGEWGQLDFGHAQMRAAVEARFLSDEVLRRQLHARISDYLETLNPNEPMIRLERMWQLIGEQNAARAAAYYAGLDESPSTPGEERIGSTWTLVEWIARDVQRATHLASAEDGPLSWVLSWLDDVDLDSSQRHRVTCNVMWGLHDRLEATVGVGPLRPLAEAVERTLSRLAAADPGNMEWQRDLSVSQNKVGAVLRAQGNLPGALEAFRRSLAMAERLAAADPGNMEWQRDLAVSHYKLAGLARQHGDQSLWEAELQQCFAVLTAMKSRGMHFDPALQQVYQQLASMFGG